MTMDEQRSLRLASICLVVGLLCRLVVTIAGERTILLNVICFLPAAYVWPVAAGAGTIAGPAVRASGRALFSAIQSRRASAACMHHRGARQRRPARIGAVVVVVIETILSHTLPPHCASPAASRPSRRRSIAQLHRSHGLSTVRSVAMR
jgi:hypothetical protein